MDLEAQDTNKKVILVDFDDVIDCLFPHWVEYLNNTYGLDKDFRKLRGWDMQYHFPTLTADQIYGCLHEESFWDNIFVQYDAIDTLNKLHSEGYEIYIVTSSSYTTMGIKWKRFFESDNSWESKVPEYLHRNVICTNNKHMIKGDVLIDDGLHNLVGGEYKKILFTAEHNKGCDYLLPSLGVHRANNWAECYHLIHELVPITPKKLPSI